MGIFEGAFDGALLGTAASLVSSSQDVGESVGAAVGGGGVTTVKLALAAARSNAGPLTQFVGSRIMDRRSDASAALLPPYW